MNEEVTGAPAEVRADDGPNTMMNALVGAVATLVTLPLLPFAAIVGGGIAGYLQRGTITEGATVGAISGALAAVPTFVVIWFVAGILLLGLPGFPFGPASIFAVVFFVVVVGYFVGAGLLGGAIGAYLRTEL